MVKYNLICSYDHEFEGWFSNESAYLDQKKKKQLTCPVCDDDVVRRAIMAPNVTAKKNKSLQKEKKGELAMYNGPHAARNLKKWIKENCEDVGSNFAKEARKAMAGERDDHIYGTATDSEMKELHEDGISALRIPNVKDH